MGRSRGRATRQGVCVALLSLFVCLWCAAGSAAEPANPAAADEDSWFDPPPAAVVEAIAMPVEVTNNDPVGTNGPPLRFLGWDPYQPNDLSAADQLVMSDLAGDHHVSWVAVQSVDGVPNARWEFDDEGEFMLFGGSQEDAVTLAAVDAGEVVLSSNTNAGDEFYTVSGDRRTLTALNDNARAFIGGETISVSDYRQLREDWRLEALPEIDPNAPDDAIGGASGGNTEPDPQPGRGVDLPASVSTTLAIAVVVPVAMASVAYVLISRSRRQA